MLISPSDGKKNGIRVLVADDEAHIRLVVGEKFRSEGCTVTEARDGEEALELALSERPDLVITDLQMPYMNGLELCTQLAADAKMSQVPALLLTARGHIVQSELLSATIIKKIMSKPFGVKNLFEQAMQLLPGASTATIEPGAGERAKVHGEAA